MPLKKTITAVQKTMTAVRGHCLLLYVRLKEDLGDSNQTWLVIVTCLFSALMALRMADVAGWVSCAPLVRFPLPGNAALIHQSEVFWDSVTNARIGVLVLLIGCLLTLISRLERWETAMLSGLTLLMAWWYVTAATMLFQLGLSISGLYWGVAVMTSITTIKTYQIFHAFARREIEMENNIKLIGNLLETYGVTDDQIKQHTRISEPSRIVETQ